MGIINQIKVWGLRNVIRDWYRFHINVRIYRFQCLLFLNYGKRKKLGIKIPDFDVEMSVGKNIGTALDHILFAMEEQGMEVPIELEEIKNWLRFKGNSMREEGDYSLWNIKQIKEAIL